MSSQREGASSSIWVAVDSVELPDKKYFKIGEVAQIVGVEPHVLRYWQTQFPQVRPQKSRSGHRLYRKKDVETLLAVRELLHVQRFTIAGARQALRSLVRGERSTPPTPAEPAREPAPRPSPPRPAARAEPAPASDNGHAEAAAVAVPADKARGQAVDVEPVNVQGLEDGQLQQAMDHQLSSRRGGVARVEVGEEADEVEVPRRVASGRAGREQLGFGFVPHNRDALVAARGELLEILAILDREDEAAPKLRAPAAQKS